MIASKTAAVTADADTALRHKVLRRIKSRPTTRGAVILSRDPPAARAAGSLHRAAEPA